MDGLTKRREKENMFAGGPDDQTMLFLTRSFSSPSFPLFQPLIFEKKPVTLVIPSTSGEEQYGQVSLRPLLVLPHVRQDVNSGLKAI